MAFPATENNSMSSVRQPRATFIYLGTANAFARFVGELARASKSLSEVQSAFIVAADRPLGTELTSLGVRTFSVPGVDVQRPLSFLRRYFPARKAILSFLETERPDLVITLMPHVWSPLLAPAIKQRCGAYVTIVHDAASHPGDPSGWVTPWLLRDARLADSVVTLTRSVADVLARKRIKPRDQIISLFHPHLTTGGGLTSRQLGTAQPFRLLFFGRILPYRGLPLLVGAIELLKERGISIVLGVAGAGDIACLNARLTALGAEVINRAFSDDEIAKLLAQYDAVACSHIEASQSGVAALAFGNCMPVVATPVGGLVEQVIPGRTGVLAANVTGPALADAIQELISVPNLYDQISHHLKESYHDWSMETFLGELISGTLPANFRPGHY